MKRISLNSGWKMNWSDYQRNIDRNSSTNCDDSQWYPADVPGDVHLDLMRAGVIPDPYVKMNTDSVLWMEQDDWWYRLRVRIPDAWFARKNTAIKLLFHGLDCFATVYWDGKPIGTHANMFTPLELDVTHLAKKGKEHLLAIRLASPIFEPLKLYSVPEPDPHAWSWGFPRQISRKPQMSYGWDIAPRLITTGLWRPVELLLIDRARISDVWLHTRSIRMDKGTAQSAGVEASIAIDVLPAARGKTLDVELFAAGQTLKKSIKPKASGETRAVFHLKIDRPELWWPNGSGYPHLYPCRVILSEKGDVIDERSCNLGVRTVMLDRSRTKDGGHRYQFVINGREIFMRGWNWTPPDAIFARITAERRETLLKLAADSGANMLRIWGGGHYEPKEFFDAADRLGLLIHQDFMMACAKFPQTDEFQKIIRDEAEYVVKAQRSHPSMAMWSGDNECDGSYKNPKTNRITRKTLPAVLQRLDHDRPYIASSPDSPNNKKYNDMADSDVHLWYHGKSYRDPLYLGFKPKFVSEIGYLSLPGEDTIKAFLADVPAWPAEGQVWSHHSTDCIRTMYFRGMKHLLRDIASCKRPVPKTLQEYIEVTQELHAEACKTWTLAYAKMPECGGILIWNLADCWPQMSDAVIAYPMDVKKAYFAAKEAFLKIGRL